MRSQLGLGGKRWLLGHGRGLRQWGQAGVGLGSMYQIMGRRWRLMDFAGNQSQGSGWWVWGLRSGWGSGVGLGSRVKARGLRAKFVSNAQLDS